MKRKTLNLFLFLLFSSTIQAQLFIKGNNVNEKTDINFIVVSLHEMANSSPDFNTYSVSITPGEYWGHFTDSTDRKAKPVLQTLTDILNYVANRGWDFVQLTSVTIREERNNAIYIDHKIIFKRKDDSTLLKN